MKYLFSNPICRKWHSMKRVSWCLSSISRISHSSIELSLYARNIVSHLFKKGGKKKNKITLRYTIRTIYMLENNLIG